MNCRLLLIFVAYHPSASEIDKLTNCLCKLRSDISFAVAVNDYIANEPVASLFDESVFFDLNSDNPGYGAAVNRIIRKIPKLPPFICILNTDLTWQPGAFESMLDWIAANHDVHLMVPRITDKYGHTQYLCKRNPTLLALFSRRFVPDSLKPAWLMRYDSWYCMRDYDYNFLFDVPYLSGCCMLARSSTFTKVGGFDEKYFLYLEDADLTRLVSHHGRCIHFPYSSICHSWGRGNYKSIRLLIVNIVSAIRYFCKWGLILW